MNRISHILIAHLILLMGTVRMCSAGVSSIGDRSAEVKAAFLLNFIRFSTWPEDVFQDKDGQLAPIMVLVLADDPAIADRLTALTRGKVFGGRSVIVRRRQAPRAVDAARQAEQMTEFAGEIESAHMLYIAAAFHEDIPEFLGHAGHATLTVSDSPGFAAMGGMIGLVRDGSRILFEANPGAIEQSDVRVSSEVLRLARIVATKEDA